MESLEQSKPRRRWEWGAWAAVSFCLGFAAGNGHTTQGAVQNISQQLGDAKKWARCEDRLAVKTAAVANKAIVGAWSATAPIPEFRDIPRDNCPHPKLDPTAQTQTIPAP